MTSTVKIMRKWGIRVVIVWFFLIINPFGLMTAVEASLTWGWGWWGIPFGPLVVFGGFVAVFALAGLFAHATEWLWDNSA